jgi:hypothetical protein
MTNTIIRKRLHIERKNKVESTNEFLLFAIHFYSIPVLANHFD